MVGRFIVCLLVRCTVYLVVGYYVDFLLVNSLGYGGECRVSYLLSLRLATICAFSSFEVFREAELWRDGDMVGSVAFVVG